eukprot:TRINITY_DN3976_c0_g2_i1.p1 TRINITY_DN3976_c0_g2~~TRINITY_DN3976_c0_g2_i1.p1  ORF type:complete len:343 (-),score=44.21 TRINITY_DN3976_c0_g2_i1:305-1333(-)
MGSGPSEPLDYATTTEHWHHVAGVKGTCCSHVPSGADPSNNVEKNGQCDCFYVHGTSDFEGFELNGNASSIGDGYAEHMKFLKRESTWANGCCKMYAPGYRQANIKTILKLAMGFECKEEVEKAQNDIEAAFVTFLNKYCTNNRPFILAGHSQGGMMVRHLVRKYIDHDPALRARMVCAYIVGCQVGRDTFDNLPIASGETDTGCIVTYSTTSDWNTDRKNESAFAQAAGVLWTKAPISINPLNWSTNDDDIASKELHMGCLDMEAVAVNKNMQLSARTCNNGSSPGYKGILLVNGEVPKGYVNSSSESYDYHEGDFPCFWQNLRANAIKRLEAFQRARGAP